LKFLALLSCKIQAYGTLESITELFLLGINLIGVPTAVKMHPVSGFADRRPLTLDNLDLTLKHHNPFGTSPLDNKGNPSSDDDSQKLLSLH